MREMWRLWKLGWKVAVRALFFFTIAGIMCLPAGALLAFSELLQEEGGGAVAVVVTIAGAVVYLINFPLALAVAAQATGHFLRPAQDRSPDGDQDVVRAMDPETGIVTEFTDPGDADSGDSDRFPVRNR